MTFSAGLFVSLEGCEGCGKSTQAKILYNKLLSINIPAILTREPGGTPLGNQVRDLLKVQRNFNINPLAELFLFATARIQLVQDVIKPALFSGKVVICDRFADSTAVYQGYGRGLDLTLIESINKIATGELQPDITLLLDTSPELGLQRKRNSKDDRFERENADFHRKIRDGYLEMAQKEPVRWFVLKPGQTIEEVSKLIWQYLLPFLKHKYPDMKYD